MSSQEEIMEKLSKILLVGGTFDPIHNGHVRMIQETQKELGIDYVFVIVDPHPVGKNPVASIEDRFKMVELVCEENDWHASNIEILYKRPEEVYTFIDTLELLRQRFPEIEFYSLVGGDQFSNFEKWRRYEEIINLTKIVVVPRKNYTIDENLLIKYKPILLQNVETPDTSSTEFRKTLRMNQVPEVVMRYILNKRLYI